MNDPQTFFYPPPNPLFPIPHKVHMLPIKIGLPYSYINPSAHPISWLDTNPYQS